jgi:hypothetical protein
MPRFVHQELTGAFVAEGAITYGCGVLPGTADNQVALPGGGDAGAENIVGIALYDAESGKAIEVVREGDVMALVNGNSVNIARNDKLKIVATTGRFVKAATDGDYFFLEANQAATTDGALISCRIVRGFRGA